MSDHPIEVTDVTNPPGTLVDPRTVASMAERVAVLEERMVNLKTDTAQIRATTHDINGEMQKFVLAEMQCVERLSKILEAIKDLPILVSAVAAFNDIRPGLQTVLTEREQRVGIALFVKKFGMICAAGAAFAALFGSITAGIVWFIQHLKPV